MKLTGNAKPTKKPNQGKRRAHEADNEPREAKDAMFGELPAGDLARLLGISSKDLRVQEVPTKMVRLDKKFLDRVFLAESPEGTCIHHIEHQSDSKPNMWLRMFFYRGHIFVWQVKNKMLHVPVVQHVLYTGAKKWKPKTSIRVMGCNYSYNHLDARKVDPAPLLNSRTPESVIFAVMCRDGTNPSVLRRVLQRVKALADRGVVEVIPKLTWWCKVRKIESLLTSELKAMGISYDFLLDTELVRDAMDRRAERVRQETAERVRQETTERVRQETTERVRQETTERVRQETTERVRQETTERVRQETTEEIIDTIVAIMRARFKRNVPGNLRGRLRKFSQQELRDVTVRAATAASVEDVLDGVSLSGSPSIAPR